MKDDDEVELTLQKLKWLRLPGMARALRELLAKAAVENLTSCEVLGRLCDEEKASRMRSAVAAKVKGARFPEVNTIDGFNFDFDPVRRKLKSRYLGLHDVTFIEKGINPLFIGTPGTGKTYLARALAWRVCQTNHRVVFVSAARMLNELHGAEIHGGLDRAMRRYVKADLLCIDDFAVLAMDAAQAKLAFQVISERYDHRRSTCITTNRIFKDWTKVFPDALNAQVIAERLTERSERFIMDGKGFRNPET